MINSYGGKSICSLRRRYKASQEFLLYTQLVQHNGSDALNNYLWETLLAVSVRADFPEQVTKARRPDFSENGPFINNEFASLIRSKKEIRQRLLSPRAFVLCIGTTLASLISSSSSSLSENDVGLLPSSFLSLSTSRMTVSVMILNQCCVERTDLHLYDCFHTLTLVNIQRIRSGQCPHLPRGISAKLGRGGGAWHK